MPLFEGLTYGDKNVVILDIGRAYTKCGVAGEMSPRCIIPSQLKDEKSGKVRRLWEFTTVEELYSNLKDFLFILYFRHLLVNPKDRRMVVCESLLCPVKFRETLAKVLFHHFEVGSIMFTPCSLTTMLTLGTNTGLVLDVGYTEALVVAVYEGIPVLKSIHALPLAGNAIHSRIKQMLINDGKLKTGVDTEKPVSESPDCLTEEVLEDIKIRCCFTTNLKRAKKIHDVHHGADPRTLPTPAPGVQYPLDGGSVLHVDGQVREHSCEVMFEQDNDRQSIPTLILDAIIQCPIDTRKELSQNVIVTGGTSMMPGFFHRLQKELYALLKEPRYASVLALKRFKFHQPPAKANYTAWLGGALYGALETLPSHSISRDDYNERATLPDWCNMAS